MVVIVANTDEGCCNPPPLACRAPLAPGVCPIQYNTAHLLSAEALDSSGLEAPQVVC